MASVPVPETLAQFEALVEEASRKVSAGEFDAVLETVPDALYGSPLWESGLLSDALRDRAYVLHAVIFDRADEFPRS